SPAVNSTATTMATLRDTLPLILSSLFLALMADGSLGPCLCATHGLEGRGTGTNSHGIPSGHLPAAPWPTTPLSLRSTIAQLANPVRGGPPGRCAARARRPWTRSFTRGAIHRRTPLRLAVVDAKSSVDGGTE